MFRDHIFSFISFLKGDSILPSCRINDDIYAIQCGYVNFYIFKKQNTFLCFDTGFNKKTILKELTKFGITPSMIKSVFLTHSDYDHIGGIDTFKDADAYISENELAMIHHGKHRPFSYRSNSVQIMRLKPLHDKMVLNIDNVTVECIMTPGHTEGSMSYLVENKYIFAGDTCKISNDTIVPLKKYINMNTNDQIVSIKKLKKYKQIEMTFVGHTGFKVGF